MLTAARRSFENLTASLQDEWTTAFSSSDKRHAAASPGGTIQQVPVPPAFDARQQAVLQLSVNKVLHKAFDSFQEDLNGQLAVINQRMDQTDANVQQVNEKVLDCQRQIAEMKAVPGGMEVQQPANDQVLHALQQVQADNQRLREELT